MSRQRRADVRDGIAHATNSFNPEPTAKAERMEASNAADSVRNAVASPANHSFAISPSPLAQG